jgi:hypothetical protein
VTVTELVMLLLVGAAVLAFAALAHAGRNKEDGE